MPNRWLHTNLIKTTPATLATDSESSTYPLVQIKDDNVASVFRTLDAAAAYHVVVDFGAATSIQSIFLGNVNFRNTATVTIAANTADSWGAPAFPAEAISVAALGSLLSTKNLYHRLASAQNYRYWRLTISDIGNPDGFYELGEFWLGNDVSLLINFTNNAPYVIERNNVEQTTEWLQDYVYGRTKRRSYTYEWLNIPATVRDQILTLEATCEGNRYPFVWVPDGDVVPRESFFMNLGNQIEVRFTAPTQFNVSLQMKEAATGFSLPAAA